MQLSCDSIVVSLDKYTRDLMQQLPYELQQMLLERVVSQRLLTDHALHLLSSEALQEVVVSRARFVTDAGLEAIAKFCSNLNSIKIGGTVRITDSNI
jgi:hypothetical protein